MSDADPAPRVAPSTLIALAGQMIVVGLSMLLARWLSPPEFEAYVVAAAAFVLMVTAAPLGVDKLALRVLPPLVAEGRAAEFRAFVGFATRRCLIGSAMAATICLAVLAVSDVPTATRNALVLSCLALPGAALAHLALEALTAAGRPASGLAILRVAVPATVAIFVFAVRPGSGAAVIAAWGAGWLMALGLARLASSPGTPAATLPGAPDVARQAQSSPLWLYRFGIGAMAQAGIFALELAGAPPFEIGAYAAAASLIGFATVLATATDRAYAGQMSRAVARRDRPAIDRLRRHRVARVAPAVVVFAPLAFHLTDALLGLYRPEFVEEGGTAFRLLIASAAVSTLFAPTTALLRLAGETRLLLRSVGAALLVQLALLFVLVPGHGATGAAASYLLAKVCLVVLSCSGSRRLADPR